MRLDGVRGGFEGSLAHLRYYTRALSPIHVRIVCDQGPPLHAANPVCDIWCYQALADLQLVAATSLATPHFAQPPWLELLLACVVEGTSRVQQAALRLLRKVLPHTQPSTCCFDWRSLSRSNRGLIAVVDKQEEVEEEEVHVKRQGAEETKNEDEKQEEKQDEKKKLGHEEKSSKAFTLAEYLLHVLGLSVWRAELHPNMAHAKIPLAALPRNLVDACSTQRESSSTNNPTTSLENASQLSAQYGGESTESQSDNGHDFDGMLGGDGNEDGEYALSVNPSSACLTPSALAEVTLLGEEVALLLRALLNQSGDVWGAHVAQTMSKSLSDLTAFMNEGLPLHAQSHSSSVLAAAPAADSSQHEVAVVGVANKGNKAENEDEEVVGALRRDAAILGLASVSVLSRLCSSSASASCDGPGGVQPGAVVTASLNNGNSQATVLLMDLATNLAHVCLHPPPAIAQFNGTAPDLPLNKSHGSSFSSSSSSSSRGLPKSLKVGRVAIDELVLVQDIHEPIIPSSCSSSSNTENNRMTSLVTQSLLPLLDRLLALGHPPTSTTPSTPPATNRRHHHSSSPPPDTVRWRVRGLYHAQLTTRCLAVASDMVDQGAWRQVAQERPQLLQRLLSLATEVKMSVMCMCMCLF